MESRQDQIRREDRYIRDFQREADEIGHLIVYTDLPVIDISIRIENLRNEAERLFPLKMQLFEWIYICRFKRLLSGYRGVIGGL